VKEEKTMKKVLKICIVALALTFFLTGVFSRPAQAATKIVKKQVYYEKTSYAKKGTAVKKGTYTIEMAGKSGFLKFKAPKTKTYTFTISNIEKKTPGDVMDDYLNGNIYFLLPYPNNKKSLGPIKVKTKGGLTDRVNVRSLENSTAGKMVYRFLTSRSASFKLKKGQTVYMFARFADARNSFRLKIK
jgi:hypothetical protein